MAGGAESGGEVPRNICKYCKKAAVTKIVRCDVCSSVLHRSCCDRKHLEIRVNNTTNCCAKVEVSDACDLPQSSLNSDKSGDEHARESETSEGERHIEENEGLNIDQGPSIADSGHSNLEGLRAEIEYLRTIIRDKQSIIDSKDVIIADKCMIIDLLQRGISDCQCNCIKKLNSDNELRNNNVNIGVSSCENHTPPIQGSPFDGVEDGTSGSSQSSEKLPSTCRDANRLSGNGNRGSDVAGARRGSFVTVTQSKNPNGGVSGSNAANTSMNRTTVSVDLRNTSDASGVTGGFGGRRPGRKYVHRAKQKQNVVIGNAEKDSCPFEAVEIRKKRWFYVSRLPLTIDEEGLKQFIVQRFRMNDCICEKIVPRRVKHVTYNTFKVGIDGDGGEDLMNPNSWPKGITLAPWLFSPPPEAEPNVS